MHPSYFEVDPEGILLVEDVSKIQFQRPNIAPNDHVAIEGVVYPANYLDLDENQIKYLNLQRMLSKERLEMEKLKVKEAQQKTSLAIMQAQADIDGNAYGDALEKHEALLKIFEQQPAKNKEEDVIPKPPTTEELERFYHRAMAMHGVKHAKEWSLPKIAYHAFADAVVETADFVAPWWWDSVCDFFTSLFTRDYSVPRWTRDGKLLIHYPNAAR